ncbi:MAG: hypothetical protein ACM3PF_01685 [Bacteroidota bacterium]
MTLAILSFALTSCSAEPKSTTTPTPTPPPQPTANAAPSGSPAAPRPARKGTPLVKKLPPGVEGVELADGGLRLLKGYEFVKNSDSTFAIARMRDGGRTGTGGSCGCSGGGGKCTDGDRGGIIVCEADSACTNCGLRLTIGGVTTEIFRY